MVTRPNPNYDLIGAIDLLAPGVVLQREALDGVALAYAAGGYQPLTQAQILAVTGALPAYPTAIVRIPDSNPLPRCG